MNVKSLLIIFTTIIATTALTACYDKGNARLIKLLKSEVPVAISFVNKDGKFIVVDAVSGEIVPPTCLPNDPSCKKLFKVPPHNGENKASGKYDAKSDMPSANSRNTGGIILSTSDTLKIKKQLVIEIIDWTGSYCRTYINRLTSEEVTRCHGNE